MNKKDAAKQFVKKNALKVYKSYEQYQVPVSVQTNATPIELVMEIVEKLNGLDGKDVLVVANYDVAVNIALYKHINTLQNLGNEYNFKSLTLLTDVAEHDPVLGSKFEVVLANLNEPAKIDMMGKKFDVVIGNPPYQISHGGSAGSPIWHKFVVLADSLLNEGGYISFVHPDGWRAGKTTFDCVSKMFKDRYNLEWLRLGDYARGRSYFGQSVGTTADVYVAKKTSERKLTKLVDVNDEEMEIDLSEAYFIPDCNIEEVSKFLAGPDDDKIEQLGGEYGTMKPFVKYAARKGDVVTDNHKYPVVWSITKGGGVNLAYSDRNDLGHYGVAKAIISNGAGAYAIADPKGEYACSEFAWNIVDTPENVVKITKALNNPRFHELMKQLGAGNWKYSRTGLKNLKKDFWKHFQD